VLRVFSCEYLNVFSQERITM